ncbi:MAG TPA: hypothetical protein EYN66_03835, partial [Myxococcales bacterium]|nr:hypothetical protein [Myxococcales bacterium]
MNRALFFFALLATSTVGCATSSKLGAEGPPRATLEVVNQTNYLQQIALDGWTLGTIERGKRARFRRLRPGVWGFSALSSVGARTTRKIPLIRGQIARWNLLPKEAGTEFPVPPGFAEITLVNQAKRDLTVHLLGRPAQSLFSGDTLRLLDIEPGARQLVIEVPGTSYHREMPLTVDAKATLSIDLTVDVGSIQIWNSTGEKVQLLLDGMVQPLIENGTSHELSDVLVGVRQLRAHGLKTGRKYYKTLSMDPNEKLSWDLSASEGRLEVVNKSGDDVSVAVDGKDVGTLSATQSRSFVDLPLGHRRVTATGQSSRYQWTINMPLQSGQSHR